MSVTGGMDGWMDVVDAGITLPAGKRVFYFLAVDEHTINLMPYACTESREI